MKKKLIALIVAGEERWVTFYKKQLYQRGKIKYTVFKKNAVIFSILERTGGCTFN